MEWNAMQCNVMYVMYVMYVMSEWGGCPHGLATPCVCGMGLGLGRGRKFFRRRPRRRRRRRRPSQGQKENLVVSQISGGRKPSKINPRRLKMEKWVSSENAACVAKEKRKKKNDTNHDFFENLMKRGSCQDHV